MKGLKDNWLLYLIVIIAFLAIYLQPNNDIVNDTGKEIKRYRDSTYTIRHEREIIKERIKTNISNIYNEKEISILLYTKDDSSRLWFIDSFLISKGAR